MKGKLFTEEQISAVLREQEAGAKAAIWPGKHGVSEATLYNWKAKYGGMDVSDAKREAVAHLEALLGLSERRACSFVGADREMIRYRSSRPPETELRGRLRDPANERRRFGYRRLFILLRREGEPSGIDHIYRLYGKKGLAVRKPRARRRAVGTRAPSWSRRSRCALVAGLRARPVC